MAGRIQGLLVAVVLLLAVGWWLRPAGQPSIREREERRLAANTAAFEAHRLGERAYAAGEFESAVRGFATAARLEPRSALAWLNCSMAQSRLGKRAEALQAIQSAVSLEPKWGVAWVHAAHVYADENRLADAKAAAERATTTDPSLADAWLVRAHVALRSGELADSESFSRRATELAPKSAPAWLALGEALLRVPGGRQLPGAIQAFEQANSLESTIYSQRLLGKALLQDGRLEPAIVALRAATKLDPRDAGCASELSLALRKSGRQAEADEWASRSRRLQEERYRVTKLTRIAEQDPGNVTAQLALARELRLRADPGGAMRAYRRVLLVDPENAAARKELAEVEAGVGH